MIVLKQDLVFGLLPQIFIAITSQSVCLRPPAAQSIQPELHLRFYAVLNVELVRFPHPLIENSLQPMCLRLTHPWLGDKQMPLGLSMSLLFRIAQTLPSFEHTPRCWNLESVKQMFLVIQSSARSSGDPKPGSEHLQYYN